MNISFGKKIPIAICNIFDNQQNKFVPATINEYDCKDKSDIEEIKSLDDNWAHKDTIALNMRVKYFSLNNNRHCDARFYALENTEGEILGISYVDDLEKNVELRFIESRNDKRYKYVGQNILATIGKNILDGNQRKFIVRSAVSSAFDFYEKVCGFKDIGYSDLAMNRFDIHKFVKQTEKRTKAPIVNLEG